ETHFTVSARAIESNLRVPIPGHVDLDFGAITPRCIRPFDCSTGVHLHAGHVHVHVELHVADIDELTVAIAKIDEDIVLAFAQSAFAIDQIHGQVVDGLSDEGRAGNSCWTDFLPYELSGEQNRDHGED